MGASIEAEQYGKDIVVLKNLVKELHPDPKTQPKVLGPSGYYDEKWFNSFLEVSGYDVVDGVTHHIYNLGLGDDPNMITKIQDPSYLNQVAQTYKGVLNIVNKVKPQSGAWVSNHEFFTVVLKICPQPLPMDFDSSFNVTLSNYEHQSRNSRSTDVAKPEFRGSKDREEYHLAALAGNIQGQIVLLNDVPMVPTETFDIPTMEPKLVNASTPISIAAHSIVYVTIETFKPSLCLNYIITLSKM
ncbi:heparanase-like protein 1 [Gossypium arboreum]|uniref:heparanase-like protein 1 n=1 Tax=Gossypium arboreum TaxID=29729 RepID=UPI0022F15EE9|nr:heparanase-like protein 1 [Gossypium arboreum]